MSHVGTWISMSAYEFAIGSGGAHRNYVVSHAFHGFTRSVVDEKTIADAKFVRDDGSDSGRTFQLQPKIADDNA